MANKHIPGINRQFSLDETEEQVVDLHRADLIAQQETDAFRQRYGTAIAKICAAYGQEALVNWGLIVWREH